MSGNARPVLHPTGLKEAPEDEEQAFVADPARDARHKDVVVDPVEKLLEIEVHNKLASFPIHVLPRLFQRHVRAASRTETVTRVGKGDRKSTRLNSSHQIISYAVFCLKKKKKRRS